MHKFLVVLKDKDEKFANMNKQLSDHGHQIEADRKRKAAEQAKKDANKLCP